MWKRSKHKYQKDKKNGIQKTMLKEIGNNRRRLLELQRSLLVDDTEGKKSCTKSRQNYAWHMRSTNKRSCIDSI